MLLFVVYFRLCFVIWKLLLILSPISSAHRSNAAQQCLSSTAASGALRSWHIQRHAAPFFVSCHTLASVAVWCCAMLCGALRWSALRCPLYSPGHMCFFSFTTLNLTAPRLIPAHLIGAAPYDMRCDTVRCFWSAARCCAVLFRAMVFFGLCLTSSNLLEITCRALRCHALPLVGWPWSPALRIDSYTLYQILCAMYWAPGTGIYVYTCDTHCWSFHCLHVVFCSCVCLFLHVWPFIPDIAGTKTETEQGNQLWTICLYHLYISSFTKPFVSR